MRHARMRRQMRHLRLNVKHVCTVVMVAAAAHAVLHHLLDADGDARLLGGPLLHVERHLESNFGRIIRISYNVYRVIHLPQDLGWVDLDLGRGTISRSWN